MLEAENYSQQAKVSLEILRRIHLHVGLAIQGIQHCSQDGFVIKIAAALRETLAAKKSKSFF